MKRAKEVLESTDNRAIHKKALKVVSEKCPFCPWHNGENRGHRPKHAVKPKKNDHRK